MFRRSARISSTPALNYKVLNQEGLKASKIAELSKLSDELERELQELSISNSKSSPLPLADDMPRSKQQQNPMQADLRKLQKENESLRAELFDLKSSLGKVGDGTGRQSRQLSVDNEERLTIKQLRKNQALSARAEDDMHFLLADDEEQDELSPLMGVSLGTPGNNGKHGKASGKTSLSGLKRTSTDYITQPQRCPQTFLGMKFSRQPVKFENLDFRLFVAGELAIISQGTGQWSREQRGRMSLLQDIVYSAGHYQWHAILSYYGQVISELESGARMWGDSTAELRAQVLAPFVKSPNREGGQSAKKKSTATAPDDSLLYCIDFNAGTCSYNEAHSREIRGKQCVVQHMCSRCWRNAKVKAGHPQFDASCPSVSHK